MKSVEPALTTEECNKLIMQEISRNLMVDIEIVPLEDVDSPETQVRLIRLRSMWENYPTLYSINSDDVTYFGGRKLRQDPAAVEE